MPKKQEKPWQYKFSFALSLVMLALVLGYFVQSFLEIRKVQPVRVAIERIGESRSGVPEASLEFPGAQAGEKGAVGE
jgi:hypothetical protein